MLSVLVLPYLPLIGLLHHTLLLWVVFLWFFLSTGEGMISSVFAYHHCALVNSGSKIHSAFFYEYREIIVEVFLTFMMPPIEKVLK